MRKFDKLINEILENVGGNTTGSVFGATQAHPTQVGKSGDFYAPGDARNIFGNSKSKKKKPKVIRRTFPGM